jgi:hypothetical protein
VQRAETTPARIDIATGAPVEVRLWLDGYQPATATVTATTEAPHTTLWMVLAPVPTPPSTGAVRVVTVPAEATIRIDGDVRGQATPLLVEGLELGVEHVLRVERDGFEPRLVSFELHSQAVRDFQLELQRAVDLGSLSVYSEPPGARVLVNGELAGPTPLEALPLVSGRDFDVELDLDGYRSVHQVVRLEPNQSQVIRERMTRPRRPGGRPADGLGTPSPGGAEDNGQQPAVQPVPENEDESPYQLLR